MNRPLRAILPMIVIAAAFLVASCTSYYQPTEYVYFPEYGYLPAAKYKNQTVVYPGLVHAEITGKDESGRWATDPIDSLPPTEAGVRQLVARNLEVLKKGQAKDALETAAYLPLAPVALTALVLPGVREHFLAREEAEYDKLGEAKRKEAEERLAKLGVEVTIEVADAEGNPLEGAWLIALVSPTPHRLYGEESGKRTFPRFPFYEFSVSDELAQLLADHMVDEQAHMEKVLRGATMARTDESGTFSHVNGVLAEAGGEVPKDGYVVHYLVAKEGFAGNAVAVRISQGGPREINAKATLGALSNRAGERRSPWQTARRLEDQVRFYEMYKYIRDPYERTAPLSLDEFKRLIDATAEVVPDYPILRKAQFYYEVEQGNIEKAKLYSEFIDNRHYMHVVYNVRWSSGYKR